MDARISVVASKPPFRAEHIGSLLRPAGADGQRARFARGEIDQAALTAAEDEAIRGAIALQEELGFKFVTDGEFRRRSYHSFFYGQLGNCQHRHDRRQRRVGREGRGHGGGRGAQPVALIGSRVQWTHPINAPDVAFLKANSTRLPKVTIPGPCALHFRGGDAAVTADGLQGHRSVLVGHRRGLRQGAVARWPTPAAATCRSTRRPSPNSAIPTCRPSLDARGDDWSKLIDKYIAVTNRILRAAPDELHIGMHLCRGNRGGHWHAEGSYEEVAERLFNALDIPFYFLEYDTPRAGTSRRFASSPSTNRWCSASSRPKCRSSRTGPRCADASTTPPNS